MKRKRFDSIFKEKKKPERILNLSFLSDFLQKGKPGRKIQLTVLLEEKSLLKQGPLSIAQLPIH